MLKKQAKTKKFAVRQGKSKVGDKSPPEEYKLQPGKSGNPKGPPKRRTNLWVYFCMYIEMTDAEIKKLKKKELSQVQKTALKLAENAAKGEYSGSERLARYVTDRDEGKPTEHVMFDEENVLSDEKCDEIREIMRKNLEAATHNKS